MKNFIQANRQKIASINFWFVVSAAITATYCPDHSMHVISDCAMILGGIVAIAVIFVGNKNVS